MTTTSNNPSDATPPSSTDPSPGESGAAEWSVSQTLGDRSILLTGSTGFLGKVYASMLLRFHPDIEQLYLLVRPRSETSAEERFRRSIAGSPAFDPLRELYGEAFEEFIDETVTVVPGDITSENLGLDDDAAAELSEKLDLIINSAGLTNFNPNLESALTINTLSQRRFLDFIRLSDAPASYIHVSTCFVAGNRSGPVEETLPGPTDYPNFDELGVDFDAEREIQDCLNLIDHAEALADDQERQSLFASKARAKLRDKNLPADDEEYFQEAYDDVRRRWLRDHLSELGMERAAHWGWPNIYTYTKSLGERILADVDDVNVSICRPAIIESSVSYPEAGWIEGVNTSGPLSYLMYRGHRFVPTSEKMNIDIIPVDFVSRGMLAISAAIIADRHDPVYQFGSTDLNPVSTHRVIELTQLGVRRTVDRDRSLSGAQKLFLKSADSIPVSQKTFDNLSAPRIRQMAEGVEGLLDRVPTESLGGFGKALETVKKGVGKAKKAAWTTERFFEVFMPFIAENDYVFRARNSVELARTLPPAEAERYRTGIEDLDWRDYWIDTHIPALAEHIFPKLDEKLAGRRDEAPTYRDLMEMFDATTVHHSSRVAMRHHKGGTVERYTYEDLRERAQRVAKRLRARGVREHTAVLLAGENRPQWGMSYFGILQADGIAVPVDPDSSVEELLNFIESSRAGVVILSPKVAARVRPDLDERLEEVGLPAAVVTFDELLNLELTGDVEGEAVEAQADAEDIDAESTVDPKRALVETAEEAGELASLIYTSGTTGQPKGVMLTHENFTELMSNLKSVFDVDPDDEFISVLPLHHTFEFACGFLLPLSEGATITYLDDLSGEELLAASSGNKASALIGVPALWELLHKRIRDQIREAPKPVSWALENLQTLNRTLRERFGVNIGPLVFAPVHRAFGGKLEYLVSGGAALPEDVLEAFYGLGFDLYEGYGLTEAAPVLTVNRPHGGITPGSVGTSLPDVEVKIHDPDDDGVGEVIARGPNVMAGYLERPDETDQTLKDGWLHTGDLGKIDEETGELRLVGRQKEVIVTSGGKNVYPDELEDFYGAHEAIEELSVVGLPDGSGSERVACLVRPAILEGADPAEAAEIRAELREWFRVQASRTASHRRIQVLRFWDQDFPRTATRKVQRTEVVDILERLLEAEKAEAVERRDGESDEWAWLDGLLARLADRDPETIHAGTHLYDDLGFDSLMFVELASVLESRDYNVSAEQLAELKTNADLRDLLEGGADGQTTAMVKVDSASHQRVEEWRIPPVVAETGKQLLRSGQMAAYDTLFDVEVYGEANIPWHNPNTIVVANHCSHLDMGLVKYALGDYGRGIRALAAADYFFSTPARKTYFKNFTNLVPVERSSTLEEALTEADRALEQGDTMLIFPEGTRSTDGKIHDFQPGLGYLVDHQNVDVLPLYLSGTYEALPKGRSLPNPAARRLRVYIGEPLSARTLKGQTEDLENRDRYKAISRLAQRSVERIRDRVEGDRDAPLEPLFDELEQNFLPEKSNGTALSFYFSLGDVADQKWSVIVEAGECRIKRGKPEDGRADCVVKTSPGLFQKIVREGYTPSVEEFMRGDIKTNDPELLRDFQQLFRI